MKDIRQILIDKRKYMHYFLMCVLVFSMNVVSAQTAVHNFATKNNEFSVKENFTITINAPYKLELSLKNSADASYLNLSPIANGYQCTITRDVVKSHKVQVIGTVKDGSNVVVSNYDKTFTVQQALPTNSNAAWMSGKWGVRFVIDGGVQLDNRMAAGYDYNLGIAQIKNELTNVDFVLTNFTNNAKGYYFTLRDHPYVDIAAEIHPEMVPSKENEQIVINAIQQLKAAGKKVLVYLASDGPHGRALNPTLQIYTTEWLNYCQAKFGGDEAAAWRHIVKGYAERFNQIGIDGFWIDHAYAMPGVHPQAHQQFRDLLLNINPNWILTFNEGINYMSNVTIKSNGYNTVQPVNAHPVPSVKSSSAISDFTDGHPTDLPSGAPVNSWGYEEYSFGAVQDQPWVTVDGKQILRFWLGPIRQSWNSPTAQLMFDADLAYRFVRTMTDAGGSYCFAITMDTQTGFKGGINQGDFNVLKEVSTRMGAMSAFTPYTRPLGAYITQEALFVGSGNWKDAASWSTNAVPTSTTDVVIQQNSVVCVSRDATVRDLLIEEGATLNVLKTVNFNITGKLRGNITYVDTNCETLVDGVSLINAPQTIIPGQNVSVTVDYTATQERKIFTYLQPKGGGAWVVSDIRTVPAGEGSIPLTFKIPSNLQDGQNTHEWISFITISPNGGWSTRLSSDAIYNVSVDSNLSLDENEVNNKFLVYPNPANNQITVNALEAGNLELVSLSGKVLYKAEIQSKGESTIDLQGLSAGVYLCRYTNSGHIKVTKLVKI